MSAPNYPSGYPLLSENNPKLWDVSINNLATSGYAVFGDNSGNVVQKYLIGQLPSGNTNYYQTAIVGNINLIGTSTDVSGANTGTYYSNGVSAIRIAADTSGNRPTTNYRGYIRYNTTSNFVEYYNSSLPTWTSLNTTQYNTATVTNNTNYGTYSLYYTDASGLNPSGYPYSGGYTVYTFNNYGAPNVDASFTFTPQPGFIADATYLLVGGGGGGGGHNGVDKSGGGGGAGGLIYGTTAIGPGSYTIIVGGGGYAGQGTYNVLNNNQYPNGNAGANGNNSSFYQTTLSSNKIIAYGGGGGAAGNGGGPYSGYNGGSGGGAVNGGSGTATGGLAYYSLYQANIGNAGGGGTAANNSGGGGGAGAGGGSIGASSSGNGGNGLQYSISGTNTYYAGGGGGGVFQGTPSGTPGTGGLGGGGNAGTAGNYNGSPGTPGTGGGGGGGGYQGSGGNNYPGGNGGSGIAILRFPTNSYGSTAARTFRTATVTGSGTGTALCTVLYTDANGLNPVLSSNYPNASQSPYLNGFTNYIFRNTNTGGSTASTFTFTPSNFSDIANYMVVGGGGAGGYSNGAGDAGGAGGAYYASTLTINSGFTYNIQVGSGGTAPGNNVTPVAGKASNIVIPASGGPASGTILSPGGGFGGQYGTSTNYSPTNTDVDGNPTNGGGGKGRGGGQPGAAAGTAPYTFITYYGGGSGTSQTAYDFAGGGGGTGSAGLAGNNPNGDTATTYAGNGGNNILNTITGLPLYYSGGGGGGTDAPGNGGLGGSNAYSGGNGQGSSTYYVANAGAQYTGQGGGGGGSSVSGIPYGGSGVVVIRFASYN